MADPTPGDGAEFRRYWTVGKGRVQWSTWTELYHHLAKHMPAEKAKRTAAQWFYDTHGYWPGDDRNRVAHGKPPRGKVVGRG